MKRVLCFMLVSLLALPALRGDDPPKEGKEPSAQERYQALVKDYTTQQREMMTEIRKLKGPEQQKLQQKYLALGKDYAEKFYKLAEDDPKGSAGTDALFWIVQNAVGSPVFQKAAEKATALIGEMPLSDLNRKIRGIRVANPTLLNAVLARAEKEEKEPAAADLLAWAATNGSAYPAGQKAAQQLVEKFPDHNAIGQLCTVLGRSPKGTETLKQILEKTSNPKVKLSAALALGKGLSAQTDKLGDNLAESDRVAAEAEKYLNVAIELSTENAATKKQAEQELKALRTLRVGKEAPEITAPDLDEKEFKLSDYRGKVVLLDFWGNW